MLRRDFLHMVGALSLTSIWSTFAQAKAEITDQPVLNRAALEALFALELPILSGESFSLASLKGKPLVLNFWATWCAPCVREMPLLDELAQAHPHVQFIGFALDTLKNMQKFDARVQVSYPLLVAGAKYLRLVKQLGNPGGGLPFTLVFDEKLQAQRLLLGEIEKEDLQGFL